MKNARMFLMVALMVGAGHIARGDDGSEHGHGKLQGDALHITVQQICPVSGEKLGTHGTPIKVTVGEQKEHVFLCRKGCLRRKLDPQHWATIHANFAKAQRICPVMKHELPKNPKWTIVEGKIVYVCCPPCTKKIAADPATYLRKVDELYAASLESDRIRQ